MENDSQDRTRRCVVSYATVSLLSWCFSHNLRVLKMKPQVIMSHECDSGERSWWSKCWTFFPLFIFLCKSCPGICFEVTEAWLGVKRVVWEKRIISWVMALFQELKRCVLLKKHLSSWMVKEYKEKQSRFLWNPLQAWGNLRKEQGSSTNLCEFFIASFSFKSSKWLKTFYFEGLQNKSINC